MPEYFNATLAREGDALHQIHLVGELDNASSRKLARLLRLDSGSLHLVDLGGLTFIDSTGVATLIEAKHRAEASGHVFELVGATRTVRHVFEICRLDDLLSDDPQPASASRCCG